ncbi:MAG: hypothetical protein RTU63_05555 [Candidatus Thorarchaeota archaeon]
MSELLNDPLNVDILRLACSGQGVDVNISELATLLGKHRNTIQTRYDALLQHEIIDPPFLPFQWLMSELPLFVIEKISLPRNPKTNLWIELDPYILAAFFVKEEEYNTLMVELHKNLYDYQLWKERILGEDQVLLKDGSEYIPSEPYFLSTKAILKDSPESALETFGNNFRRGYHPKINDLELDDVSVKLVQALIAGKGVHVNPNALAKSLDVHRKTIQRRLDMLLEEKIVSPPACRFPRIWTPPDYFLVISLHEIRKNKDRISKLLVEDPHVTLMFRASVGRYNLLTFNCFYRMNDYLAWQEEYDQRFPETFGAVKNFYLSPAMTFAINQHYVSQEYLNTQKAKLRGRDLMDSIK